MKRVRKQGHAAGEHRDEQLERARCEKAERGDDDPELSYAEEELVVESIAYTVCGSVGLDVSGYAIPYLASWSEGT